MTVYISNGGTAVVGGSGITTEYGDFGAKIIPKAKKTKTKKADLNVYGIDIALKLDPPNTDSVQPQNYVDICVPLSRAIPNHGHKRCSSQKRPRSTNDPPISSTITRRLAQKALVDKKPSLQSSRAICVDNFPASYLVVTCNNIALTWIQDNDYRDLSSKYWYKIRFPDGSELSAGQKATTSSQYDNIVGPPNTGVAVTISSKTSAEVCLQEATTGYLKGKTTRGDGSKASELSLYLSLSDAGNQLYWYESNTPYGIAANQLNGRVGLFAKDKNGNTLGLRPIQHGSYWEIHSGNKCKLPLEYCHCANVTYKTELYFEYGSLELKHALTARKERASSKSSVNSGTEDCLATSGLLTDPRAIANDRSDLASDRTPSQRCDASHVSLLLLLSTATATRSGALVESTSNAGSNKALRFRDVELMVVPHVKYHTKSRIMANIDFVHVKNEERGATKPVHPVTPLLHVVARATTYGQLSYSLIAGFKKPLELYQLRRASGTLINGTDIVRQRWPPQRNEARSWGRLGTHINDIIYLLTSQRISSLSISAQGYRIVKNAPGQPLHDKYTSTTKEINATYKKLRERRLGQAIYDFYRSVDTKEIERQLNKPTADEVLAQPTQNIQLSKWKAILFRPIQFDNTRIKFIQRYPDCTIYQKRTFH
ncbi:hypothetical protein GQ44DRAFT_725215 [Phaeosphaeriaceae sp. PMI808]|nr:hypothetical protein GQ44DRAFT_725215 [Phaeosphaeriaceae sp. PMI808]